MSTPYPGLTNKEQLDLNSLIFMLRTNENSEEAKKARTAFFVKGQKLAKMRYLLRYLFTNTHITLTDDELDVIRSVAIKPKSSSASIIEIIIRTQFQLSGEEVLEWFSHVNKQDYATVTITILEDDRVTDEKFKLDLSLLMLNHFNHARTIILAVDKNIDKSDNSIWSKIFYLIVDEINKESKISDRLSTIWASESRNLNNYARKQSVKSSIMYVKTKHEFYLPTEAQDIFLF